MNKSWLIPILILIFAFSIRFIYLEEIKPNPLFSNLLLDAEVYDKWALDIASGNVFGKEIFFFGPLYPYLLSLVYMSLGRDLYMVRLLQAIIGTLTCLLVYFIALKTFNRGTALLSALFASLYGVLIFYEGFLLMATVVTFLNTLTFLLLILAMEKSDTRLWFISGLTLGLSALGRPNVLLFALFVVIWAHLFSKDKIPVLVFCLALMLVISSVTLRNYIVGKDFVPIVSQYGINFFIGNNENSTGTFIAPLPNANAPMSLKVRSTEYAMMESNADLKPSGVSNFWISKSLRFITEHPLKYLKLMIKKFLLFWNAYEIPSNTNYYFFAKFSNILKSPFLLSFRMLGPLCLLGITISTLKSRKTILMLLIILTYNIALVLFFVESRYRLPAVPFMIIFASYALYWLYERLKKRGYRAVALFIILLIPSYLFVNYDVDRIGINPGVDMAYSYYNMAEVFKRNGLFGEAINHYKMAIELYPKMTMAHCNLGDVYSRMGQYQRAAIEYDRAEFIDREYTLRYCRPRRR